MAILEANPLAKEVRTDMRHRVKKLEIPYNQARARWNAVTREDIARATQRTNDGTLLGLYRESDDLYPILLRQSEAERKTAANLDTLQVRPALSADTVALVQVTDPITVRSSHHPPAECGR